MAAPITLPDEIADALPAQPVETILVDTLTYAECGACPEHGPVADAIATVAHTGPESDLVYREGACAEHLAEVVRFEARIRHNKVWIEVSQVECWAPLPTNSGYEVSTFGRVRSVDRVIACADGRNMRRPGCMLRPKINPHRGGYAHVSISGRTIYIHRLVLETFVGPRPMGMECRHQDGNPLNNHLFNLRWGTPSSNAHDSVRHGTHDRANRTHCPRRHPLVEPNLVPNALRRGRRNCLACKRAAGRAEYITARGEVAYLQALSDDCYHEIVDAPTARSLCRCRTPEHGCTWCTEGDEDRGYTAAEYLAARDDRDAS